MNRIFAHIVRSAGLGIFALGAVLSSTALAQPAPETDGATLYEAAKGEGSLVWYTTNALDLSNALADYFEQQYPGVSVDVSRYIGTEQYQRYLQESEAGQNIADIVNISDKPLITSLVEEGYLAEWKVPTFERFPEQFRIQNHVYSPNKTIAAIIYNTNNVTDEEAALLEAGWQNILDPRFKGRFAVTTQKNGLVYSGIHMMLDPALSSTFPPDFFEQLKAQEPAIYNDVLNPVDRVIVGESDFTFWSWDGIAAAKLAAGAPIRWVYPKPTPAFPNNWFAISATAPHPNAARLFLNWLTSDEGAVALQKTLGNATSLEGVADQRAFTGESWFRPMSDPYSVDFTRWERDYQTDFDRWIGALGN